MVSITNNGGHFMEQNLDLKNKLLTFKQVCEILAMKESRLRYSVFHKEIPYVKVGMMIRFRPSDIQDFINSRIVKAGEK